MDYTGTMRRLVIRQTSNATLSADQAEGVVCAFDQARVVNRDGKTLLVDFDPCEIERLRERLPGWLVSEQGPPVPVPDHCLRIKT
jgi:hypothetical protein